MKPTALILYHKINQLDNILIASFNEISSRTGISRRGCIYAIRSLEKAGLLVTLKVYTGHGRYTNAYITFPLNKPFSPDNPQPSHIERIQVALEKLVTMGYTRIVLPKNVSSLIQNLSALGANFAPGALYTMHSNNNNNNQVNKRVKHRDIYVNVKKLPGAKNPDKGKKQEEKALPVRFVDRPGLAKNHEIEVDLFPFFGVKKIMLVSGWTVRRVRAAVEAVVAYGRKYQIRNLEAILVAAVTRGWRVARKVIDWVKAKVLPGFAARKEEAPQEDKYRALYRLVTEEEAEAIRKTCKAPEEPREDKYRDLYKLEPEGCSV